MRRDYFQFRNIARLNYRKSFPFSLTPLKVAFWICVYLADFFGRRTSSHELTLRKRADTDFPHGGRVVGFLGAHADVIGIASDR
jgi:hypothetical protein